MPSAGDVFLINKLVIQNLKQRPVRSILSVLAIGLEVTMILTLVGLSKGMLSDSQRRARGVGADIWVRPSGSSALSFGSASIPEKMIGFLMQQPHVAVATGSVVYPLQGFESVTGIDLDQFKKLNGGFVFQSGTPFRNPDDIVVDQYYAQQKGLQAGSRLKLLNRTWRVAGIVEPGRLARIILPLAVLQDLTGNTGKLSQIFVKLDKPGGLSPAMANLKQKIPNLQFYSMEEYTSFFSVNNVPGLKAFIWVIIFLSVAVGFLVVFLSMYTAVLERTREIGILKSLGASAGYVLNVILRETAALALVGWLVGIGLSYVSRALIMGLVPASLAAEIVPEWWPIVAVIALTGALIGAAYPGWRAARQDPIEALAYE